MIEGLTLVTLSIPFIDFAGEEKVGELEVHPAMAPATQTLFAALKEWRFPIFSMTPRLQGERQMRLFNTVGYLPKKRTGKQSPSHHAAGLAFDINPPLNPFVWAERGMRVPPFAAYVPGVPGTITAGIAALAKDLGFNWGGDWREKKDYMHFSFDACEGVVPGLKPERPGAVFA